MFYSSTDNKWLTCTEHTVFGLLKATSNILPKGTKMRWVSKGSHAGLISCMLEGHVARNCAIRFLFNCWACFIVSCSFFIRCKCWWYWILSVSACSFAWFNSWTIFWSLVLPCFSESSRSWSWIFYALGRLVNIDSATEIITLTAPSPEVDCAGLAWISFYRASKSTRWTSRQQACIEHRFSANMYTTSRWQA